jgi:hypothetical protein
MPAAAVAYPDANGLRPYAPAMKNGVSPEDVRAGILAAHGPHAQHPAAALGPPSAPVAVWLQPESTAYGQLLTERFGAAIDVRLVLNSISDRPLAAPPTEWELPHPALPLKAACIPTGTAILGGSGARTRVLLNNIGTSRIAYTVIADVAVICDPCSHVVIGTFDGPRTGVARSLALDPGGELAVDVILGTEGLSATKLTDGRGEIVAPLRIVGQRQSWLLYARGIAEFQTS